MLMLKFDFEFDLEIQVFVNTFCFDAIFRSIQLEHTRCTIMVDMANNPIWIAFVSFGLLSNGRHDTLYAK